MEAMACGAPVVSGDLPAIRELVVDAETGILIDGNRAEQLSAALVRLVDEPALRAGLARAARERVSHEFSLDGNVTRLTHLFELKHSGKTAYTGRDAVSTRP
jgi:glycosyltransferase involved in cell wall biosynthesis